MKKLISVLLFIFSFFQKVEICLAEYNNCFDVYYYADSNFGDNLNKDLLNYLGINYKFKSIHDARYIFMGSVLGFGFKEKVNTFGVGMLFPKVNLPKDMKVYSLRGEKTKQYIEKVTGKNLSSCLLGDPALLVSEIFPQKKEKVYDVGIVCHYVDADSPYIKNIKLSNKTYTFIDVRSPTRDFCEKINQCKFILSSALHPIIASDSYGIPNRRIILLKDVEISKNIKESLDFKFDDYYSIYKNTKIFRPIDLRHEKITDTDIDTFTKEYNISQKVVKKFCEKYKKLIKNYFFDAYHLQDGVYTISSKINKDMVLDIGGDNLLLWKQHGGNNQRFCVKSIGNGFYEIKAMHSKKMLEVFLQSKDSKNNVWQNEKNNTNAQKWMIKRTDDGFFNIISVCNDLYLSTDKNVNCGTNVCVKNSDETDTQKFIFSGI